MEKASLMVLLLSALLLHSIADDGAFDVRQHVSTVTRYGVVNNVTDNSFVPSNIPDQCTPIHLNLVIPRASASAVAFGMGLLSGRGNLGPGHNRSFAVTTESRASDILLRFHDCCQNYKEASLLNITDQACALFTPSEVVLLEWTDDLELFKLKGYGNALNYQMGVPLLEDVVQSMEQAIMEEHAPGSYEKTRLRFAHAETLLPFSCLIGLFLEESDFEKIQKEQPLQLPPKPPQRRNWRGKVAAPFGGNNMMVVYSCPAKSSSKYFVHVLHNEHPVPMPGCDNSDFCPFEVFKERIVAPHLKCDYNTICNLESENPEPMALTSKLSQMFRWLFAQRF